MDGKCKVTEKIPTSERQKSPHFLLHRGYKTTLPTPSPQLSTADDRWQSQSTWVSRGRIAKCARLKNVCVFPVRTNYFIY
ncbi:hypothetical protein Pmani_019242 [Petrolisthes manimaculis]|uniref:Uncharacterized protein n=1 Tax=Petrolisthes manimaculis TaxID=1843537 RepID=A0AAE1U457_9EUCA|nr:hypothetical protein Pmani_019242 [Petrolisthes manimaculis]